MLKRKSRVRRKIASRSQRVRLSVFRSHQHIFAQIIDDAKSVTLAAAASTGSAGGSKIDRAYIVGQTIAKKAKIKNIKYVVFDRGRYKFHGRIKALADGARQQGLMF